MSRCEFSSGLIRLAWALFAPQDTKYVEQNNSSWGIYVALFNGVRYVMLQTMKLAWKREFVCFFSPRMKIIGDENELALISDGFFHFSFISDVSIDLCVTCLIWCVQIRLLAGRRERVFFFLFSFSCR